MSRVDRASAGVARWVRVYTGGLDSSTAASRREEVQGDVRDQIEWSRAAGHDEAAIARSLRSRALRGVAADVSWAVDAGLRTPMPAIEHPLRLIVSAVAVGLIVLGAFSLGRRPVTDAPLEALVLLAGVAIAGGAVVLLVRTRTRAWGALWVVAGAQIIMVDGIRYLAESTTILAHVSETNEWARSVLLADLGVSVLGVSAAIWWATNGRQAPVR